MCPSLVISALRGALINLLDGLNMLIQNEMKALSSRKWFNQLPPWTTPLPPPHSLINLFFHYNKTQISLDRGFVKRAKTRNRDTKMLRWKIILLISLIYS